MRVRTNKLEEVWLEVDCDLIHTIHELADTLSCAHVEGSVGVAASGQVAEISPDVGWPGAGVRVSKGKGKEQAVEEGDGDDPDVNYLE